MQSRELHPLPIIKTDRLLLRGLETADATDIALLRSDARVNQYLNRPPTTTFEQAEAFISKIQKSVAENTSYYWAITLNSQPALIGTICLWNIDAELASAEIGYELHPDFQGRGLMREAVSAVLSFAFENRGFKTIAAVTTPENAASIKLLNSLNFYRDLDADNQPGSEISFSIKSPAL